MISVLFFATIRDFTKERETTVQDERSLGDLLSRLCERYGDEFRRELLDETGTALSDRVIVLVNGRHTA
ncbi:MAG TPA: molybdopterin synthase sulfur carrier subunit, partial [Synergistaceae bacterium]|nr:molybdopterin synthase sulfur carrier subunit [Synergistaceae bacterium]